MELWVRSQDKTHLFKPDCFYIRKYSCGEDNLKYEIISKNDNMFTKAGIYETKERALEVLDKIHQRLIDLQTVEIAPDCAGTIHRDINCVYEMPKE